jgi:hypothetical protein
MSETELKPPDYSGPFTRMADKIDLNSSGDFAGAFVVVTPSGDTHTMLLLDSAKNEAIFWGTVKSMVDINLSAIDERERMMAPGGFSRR